MWTPLLLAVALGLGLGGAYPLGAVSLCPRLPVGSCPAHDSAFARALWPPLHPELSRIRPERFATRRSAQATMSLQPADPPRRERARLRRETTGRLTNADSVAVPASARALGTAPRTPAPGAALSPRQINPLPTEASSLRDLLGVYKRHGSSFNEVNVATAWNRLGRSRATDRERADFFRQEEHTLLQLLQHTERAIPSLGARGLANACYGMAKLRFEPASATMCLLGAEAVPRIGEFEPQGLANTAWAFATMGTPAPQLFVAIARESEQRIASFKPQGLSNTAWAFATLGTSAPQLFEAIACESKQRISSFNDQNLVGTPTPQLFEAIARESEQRIGSFKPQELAITAWSFAIVGTADRGALLRVLIARATEMGLAAFIGDGRRQLHQFFLGVELEACLPAELLAPIGLRDACRQAMADDKPVRSSKLQKDVSKVLTRIGIVHANELCVPRLGYHVDIAILPAAETRGADADGAAPRQSAGAVSGEGGDALAELLDDEAAARAREALRAVMASHAGIVIEVDGPSHYDDERRLLPASEMIRRHLTLAGWAVLGVPYWEWNALKGHAQKAAYLAELLSSLPRIAYK
ncbi:hypothetical protein T492DRAFT_1103190 [Pavlovales sp. CCMP2436]|nr:hypothetical protein T492DRAFT_1103190 [Pavlovales sp. CCMP2436]